MHEDVHCCEGVTSVRGLLDGAIAQCLAIQWLADQIVRLSGGVHILLLVRSPERAMPRRSRVRQQAQTSHSAVVGAGSPLDLVPDEVLLQVLGELDMLSCGLQACKPA